MSTLFEGITAQAMLVGAGAFLAVCAPAKAASMRAETVREISFFIRGTPILRACEMLTFFQVYPWGRHDGKMVT